MSDESSNSGSFGGEGEPAVVVARLSNAHNNPAGQLFFSTDGDEPEPTTRTRMATYFDRHPNVRTGLAITGLVVGLAAIALATVATCGVAGLLGVAAASVAATLTFGASLTTVGAVAGGVGLFGGLSVAGGAYLMHTRPGRGVVTGSKSEEDSEINSSQSVDGEDDNESFKKARFTQVRSLAVIQELEYFFTGSEVQSNGVEYFRDHEFPDKHGFLLVLRAKLIARDFVNFFKGKGADSPSLPLSRVPSLQVNI